MTTVMTRSSALAVPSPAFVVERYAVFDEFAAGGMASVHLAQLRAAGGFRRTVAVKRLLPHLTRNQDFVLMLLDEARLAARISHPNVVTTLEVVQSEREVLLVMEYIHGESLAKLLRWARERGERIPVPMACAIVADVLHGLHAAHEAKDEHGRALAVVHRDVSPQNILVGLDGVPRVADFGVAKAAGRSQTTRDGILKGKLAYMAPEQLESGETSRVSDVFSAAVVLWEALTGERLFMGKNHAETAFKILSAPVAPPSTRNPAIPAALDAVLMRGLARPPTQRFPTAREMALAIEQSVAGVRPSDLARWVEQIVGDRLDERLSKLRAIERSHSAHDVQDARDVDLDARTRVHARSPRARDVQGARNVDTEARTQAHAGPARASDVHDARNVDTEAGTQVHGRVADASDVHAARGVALEAGTPGRLFGARYGAWAALLAISALAIAVAWRLTAGTSELSAHAPRLTSLAPEAQPAAARDNTPTVREAPPVTRVPQPTAAGGDSAVPVALPPTAAKLSPAASMSLPPRAAGRLSSPASQHSAALPRTAGAASTASSKPIGTAAAARKRVQDAVATTESSGAAPARTKAAVKARVRSDRVVARDENADCDPPFTIDHDGHRVFKAACMQ